MLEALAALESVPSLGRELTLDARIGVDSAEVAPIVRHGWTATSFITPYGQAAVELERDLLDDRDGAFDAFLDGLCCVGRVRSSSGPSRGAGGAFGTGRNGELAHKIDSADLGKALTTAIWLKCLRFFFFHANVVVRGCMNCYMFLVG